MSKNTTKICTVEFESTETSHPFEKRTLTLKPGTEHEIGRLGKKRPSSFEETLLFDTRSLSRKQAKLFFQKGRLYLLDLNSSHGTFVNGKAIPVDGKEDGKTLVSNAYEVKTDDIVRFGTTRKTCSSGEVFAAVEGRLTVKITSVVKEKAKDKDARTKDPVGEIEQPYTPSEGPQLVEKEQNQARKSTSPKIPLPKGDARKWSLLLPVENVQKGTLTDSIDTTSSGSQTVSPEGGTDGDQRYNNESEETISPEGGTDEDQRYNNESEEKVPPAEEADGDQRYYKEWQETEREFSVYRRQTLKLIVVCLLVAVLYHLVANSMEVTISHRGPCRM